MTILTSFYRKLVKAPITLEERAFLADIFSSASRTENLQSWNECKSFLADLSQPLAHLRKFGYLPISIQSASSVVSELNSLPSNGIPNASSGNRTEVENLNGVSQLKSIQNMFHDKRLWALVSLYLGAPAHLHTCQAWWQYPMSSGHKPSNAQLWHRDRDDFSELKLFFYGTDVSPDCGPHAFVPHSHSVDGLSKIFPQSALKDSVINGSFNDFVDDSFFQNHGFTGDFKKWLGPAGTCFLEDTRGFHRAYVPTHQPRLLLSLVWTVGPGF